MQFPGLLLSSYNSEMSGRQQGSCRSADVPMQTCMAEAVPEKAAFLHLHRQPGEQGKSWEVIDQFLRTISSEVLVLKYQCLWFQ